MFLSGFSRISIRLSRHNCNYLEYKYSENGLISHEKSPDGKFTNLWIVILLKSKTSQPRYLWEKNQEERKTPVIVVKKTSYFFRHRPYPKKQILSHLYLLNRRQNQPPAGINSSAVETHIPRSASQKKKKEKDTVFHVPPTGPVSILTSAWKKIKALFPHLRAEGGGFIPLKIGISNDISAFLAEHPETELTMDEWLCAVSCITSRRVYLQRTAVAGVPRYGSGWSPQRAGLRL